MDELFNVCVQALNLIASLTGLSYNAVNIWIFVIIEPLVFLGMLVYILRLRKMKWMAIIKAFLIASGAIVFILLWIIKIDVMLEGLFIQ